MRALCGGSRRGTLRVSSWAAALWGACFAVLLLGCTAQNRVRENSPQLAELCTEIQNSYECAQAIEAHQLRKPDLARRVTRNHAELRLELTDGKVATLRDAQPADPASVVKYSFRDYLGEIGYFIVHRQYYEGEEFVLVDDGTGKMYTLPSVPVISPDRSRVVATFPGLTGGYNPNTVQIWRLTTAGMTEEFETHPTEWEPVDAAWIDNTTVRLRTRTQFGDKGETVTLKMRDGKWTLDGDTK